MAITISAARWRSERGAELIEFALVMPILMLLIAGIFDFGMMFRTYETVTNAAREGARVGVLPGYEADVNVEDRVDAYMASSGLTGAYTVDVDDVPVVIAGAGTFTARAVRVNYTYQFAILGGVGSFFGGNFTTVPLAARSVMRYETQAVPAP
jgi:Flp pilus assembly protein TadG